MGATTNRSEVGMLVVPAFLLGVLMLWLATELRVVSIPWSGRSNTVSPPETVVIESRPFAYREGGEFLRAGHPEDAPLVHVTDPPPLEIMKFEVSAAEYSFCVKDGACRPPSVSHDRRGDVPATGISYSDATAYAEWLSANTGSRWRLPSLSEWVFAAGEQAADPALLFKTDAGNPASRWLALYEQEALLREAAAELPERGASGLNEFGVADIQGSVWEWTSTCNSRTLLDTRGTLVSRIESCGVRLVEGRHRTAMSFFIRKGRSGGCSIGAPPDYLGFRLVRERT